MPKDLKPILEAENVATLLDKELLDKISYQAVQGYEGDETSRKDWKESTQAFIFRLFPAYCGLGAPNRRVCPAGFDPATS